MARKLIGTADAAKRLGVTRMRVVQLINEKRLRAEKIAGVWLIEPKNLTAVRHRPTGRPRKDSDTA